GVRRCQRNGARRAEAMRARRRARMRQTGVRLAGASIFAAVEHVAAAVLRPAVFRMLAADRFLLAQAYRLDLVLLGAEDRQRPLDAVGAALPETDVVLAAAALVGIALDQHLRARVLAQVLRMRLDQGAELVLDVELVEVVVDRAPGQDVVRVLERTPRRGLAGQV